jgi:Enolase
MLRASASAFTLPVPTMNVLNGRKYAGNDLAIQEFMVQPFRNTIAVASVLGSPRPWSISMIEYSFSVKLTG